MQLGVPVPPGFVINAAACANRRRGDALPASLVTALSQELVNRGWGDQALAVRSSASTEDSARASFAGIYRSCLNVRGVDALVRAVQEVLDSLWEPAAIAYRQRFELAEDDAAMAVVVMPLIRAVASGDRVHLRSGHRSRRSTRHPRKLGIWRSAGWRPRGGRRVSTRMPVSQ